MLRALHAVQTLRPTDSLSVSAAGKLLLVCAALLTAACGESAKDLVRQNETVLEATFAKFARIADDVAKQPPVKQDALSVPAGVKLVFSFGTGDGLNAAVIYPGHLREPCDGDELHWHNEGGHKNRETQILRPPMDNTDVWLAHAACLLRKGTGRWGSEAASAELVRDSLPRMAQVKYLLVPRIRAIRPALNLKEPGDKTFKAGSVVGDALLYEVDTARHLGGFTIAAANEDSIEVHKGSYNALELNLLGQAAMQMQTKVHALAPGSVMPR